MPDVKPGTNPPAQFVERTALSPLITLSALNRDKDCRAVWAERDGNVSLIVFTNDKALRSVTGAGKASGKRHGSWAARVML